MGIGGLVVQGIIGDCIDCIGKNANNVQVANLLFNLLALDYFFVYLKEKNEEHYLVDIINYYVVPIVSPIGKKLILIIILDKISQYFGEKSINDEYR